MSPSQLLAVVRIVKQDTEKLLVPGVQWVWAAAVGSVVCATQLLPGADVL